jgi:hypothetical protein
MEKVNKSVSGNVGLEEFAKMNINKSGDDPKKNSRIPSKMMDDHEMMGQRGQNKDTNESDSIKKWRTDP